MNELTVSNEAAKDSAELQRRIEEDGYLFFRGLLDANRLMSLRREMLELMQDGGWLPAPTQYWESQTSTREAPKGIPDTQTFIIRSIVCNRSMRWHIVQRSWTYCNK
jgi:hypothetical protein